MSEFKRVVAIVSPSWSKASQVANHLSGRGLFLVDGVSDDIEREVCDGNLYLVYALDNSTARWQLPEVMEKLMFLFLSSHFVVWVDDRLSQTPFRYISWLALSRQRVSSSASPGGKKGNQNLRDWPGNCYPWLLPASFGEDPLFDETARKFGKLKSQLCRTNSECCIKIKFNEDQTDLIERVTKSKTTESIFPSEDWLQKAADLSHCLDLLSNNSKGFIGAINSTDQSEKKKKRSNIMGNFLESTFCTSVCKKGIKAALENYTKNLPTRYNSATHNSRVTMVQQEFRSFVGFGGSIVSKSEVQIKKECERIWRGQSNDKSDRRLCDAVSLSGRPCILPHKSCLNSNNKVDLSKCMSGHVERLACSCGQSIVERKDPFEEIASLTISARCCAACETIDLNFERTKSPRKKYDGWRLHVIDSSYDTTMGLEYAHFVSGFTRMEPWESVLIGLEYECISLATRQFFAVSSLASYEASTRDSTSDGLKYWPDFDIDLFLAPDHEHLAQLQRIYVVTTDDVVSLHAQVEFDGSDILYSHKAVPLPVNSLVCLSLPHTYVSRTHGFRQPVSVPGQRFRSIARLKAGLIKSSELDKFQNQN